jgi:hypothetical protein
MQFSLPLLAPACMRCPYWVREWCRGPEGTPSRKQREGKLDCISPEVQEAAYRELHDGWIPTDVPSLHDRISLPRFIPGIPTRAKWRRPRFDREMVFGVSFKSLIEKDGGLSYTSPRQLRAALRLPADARLALIANADDPRIEAFWKRAAKRNAWSKLEGLQFEFATSCTFSVWDNDPRFDQIYNQERNWRTYDLFSSLGLPTIPFVFSLRHRNQLELGLLFEQHPEVRIVAMLAQCLRSKDQFNEFLEDMQAVAEAAHRTLHFLVVGVAEPGRMRRIAQRFSASFVTDQPIRCAIHGKLVSQNLKPVKAPREISRGRIAAANLRRYADFIDALPIHPSPTALTLASTGVLNTTKVGRDGDSSIRPPRRASRRSDEERWKGAARPR